MDVRQNPTPEFIAAVRRKYHVERTVDTALTRKMNLRCGPRYAPANSAEFEVRLTAFLGTQLDRPFTIKNLRPLGGGASKEQFVFDLDYWIDGDHRESEKMIARRSPYESAVETNPQREFQSVKALDGLIPVPKAYWIDEDGTHFGRPTQIYSFVGGVQKPSGGSGNVSGIGTYFPAHLRPGLSADFVDILAEFHRHAPDAAALPAFDMPRVGTNEGALRTVNWWARVWEEDRLEDVPLMAVAENWLRAKAPTLDRVSIIHGDYRSGNFLFDEAQCRITAILDWELSYLGDRHADLAWAMFDSFATDGEQGERLMSGLLPKDAFIARYEAASGLPVDPARLAYFNILELWKGVVLTAASSARVANGLKTHQNILLAWSANLSFPLLESLRRLLTVEFER